MSLTAEPITRKTNPEAHLAAEVHLDPMDWAAFRKQAHCMLEDILDYVEKIRDRPVWQPMPTLVRAVFRSPVPRLPTDLSAVHQEFLRNVLPYAGGNVHPGFMGWVQGGGTPVGIVAEMLAAGLNANLGGRDHAPVEVERQIVQWMREIFAFPETATGLFVTGTSMANFLATVIARDAAAGFAVRCAGVAAAGGRLRAYASVAAHGCIARGLDLCGLGSDSLRLIPAGTHHRLDIHALQQAIESDRAAGFVPFMAIGTAGTVDTGAIDDLSAIASVCRREKLWFHVDGAFGALAMLAPDLAPRLNGIELADSLAFDFHKWGQVPYDAGFLLVRDGVLHRKAFASAAAYLSRSDRGLAAGAPWLCDFGPDLSRGFRALKTWMTLKVFGTDALGAAISRTCAVARHLERRIAGTPELELLAPVELNIVCFRYRAEDADRLNAKLVVELHESGIVAPSATVIDGRTAIRAAIVNHRTTCADADALIDTVLAQGRTARPRTTAPPPLEQPRRPAAHRTPQALLDEVDALLAQHPRSVPLLFRRGLLLFQAGANEEAEKAWREALSIEPDHLGALNSLGDLFFAAGDLPAARGMYSAAVARHAGHAGSRVNLANLLIKERQLESAREQLECALRIDPQCRPAHAGLSFVLADLGERESAAHHRRIAFERRCFVPAPYRGKQPPIEILELLSTSGGNVRMRAFLSDRIFKKYLIAAQFYDATMPLPPHRLVVNSIGDVETGGEALSGAQRLVEHTHAPVINAPSAVLRTTRAEVARRVGEIPGVVAPRIVRFPRAALATPEASETLADAGFRFPLLLRAPGFHGGEHFVKLETPAELQAALCELPGAELDAIEYLDARVADGKIRKYRVMLIDGRLYPLHAAISRHWKIHYFSAEMADHPENRAEEADFLRGMAGTLGQPAMTALTEIQGVLGLDYGGIDFGLDGNRNILLFEANATMAILPPDPDARWTYRRPAFDEACLAVHHMLLARAQNTAQTVADNYH